MLATIMTAVFATLAVSEPVALVAGAEPTALIVLPENPYPIATFAAEELVYHVEKATGARLKVVNEPAAREPGRPVIYLGATQAARDAGIEVDAASSEAVVLRTVGEDLFIVGKDAEGDPLNKRMTRAGTLWGVYEVLERYLGVRWLWPGPLGEHVPKTDSVLIPALDETIVPRFNQRLLRPGLGPKGFAEAHERVAFSPEAREDYAKNQTLFLRRHRMGMSDDSYYAQPSSGSGHSFEGWWEEYGEEHPDWFQLNADGTRGPLDPSRPNRVTMCVSNEGLHAEIVRRWETFRQKYPGEPVNIGVGENDDSGACLCEKCLEWNGPPPDLSNLPAGLERSYEPTQASNRYARFLEAVRSKAAEIDPNVRVHMYAYVNYFWAPDPEIKLHPNIVIGFVPWFRWAGWFPRTDAEQEWIKEQWMGWQRSGASVYYRPNWFLDGYTMPLVYVHQFADAFQFYARHGMTGTDFDSLQGQWAAQGPNLYVLARIHVRPEMDIEALLDEYYGAFGPAASAVEEYFTYWEDYAIENSSRSADTIRSQEDRFRRYANYALVADALYPPEVFAPAWEILERAKKDTEDADEPVYAERVEFLRQGLRHAEQCVMTAAVVNDPDATMEQRIKAIAKLATIRRELEHTGIANMDRAGIIETDSWEDIQGLFEP
ncbi:MAG: hypothetical protein AMXMBFR82_34530 [Candidatus Hydrogenedentota bacterium]